MSNGIKINKCIYYNVSQNRISRDKLKETTIYNNQSNRLKKREKGRKGEDNDNITGHKKRERKRERDREREREREGGGEKERIITNNKLKQKYNIFTKLTTKTILT